jgi:hypothetical protein
MVKAPVSRVFDPVVTMVAAVAVIVGSLCVEPPRSAGTTVRAAAIAVDLQAVTIQTALAGTAAAETALVSDAAGSDQPAATTVAPDDLIGNVANLVVTLAGAALWYAAFPITLPATMIGGSILFAIAGYFRCFCFAFPAPDVVVTNGLTVFFEFPAFAVQSAIARFQPSQSVAAAASARAGAGVGTAPPSADPEAPNPAVGDRVGMRPGAADKPEVSNSSADFEVPAAGKREAEPAQLEGKRIRARTAIRTRPSSPRPVLPAQASALPTVSEGTATATAGPASRAPRRAPAGRR